MLKKTFCVFRLEGEVSYSSRLVHIQVRLQPNSIVHVDGQSAVTNIVFSYSLTYFLTQPVKVGGKLHSSLDHWDVKKLL